ncbi:MAG: copper uptake system-associated protein [Candidatus Methylumidiphilus sp.]
MTSKSLLPIGSLACLAMLCPGSFAQDSRAALTNASTRHAKTQSADVHAIQLAMKKLFDKPGAPLTVHPVSVEGDYALAGWVQDQKGGRALLRKESKGWAIVVCGGDQLNQAAAFKLAGLSDTAALQLEGKVQLAESRLTAEQRKKLSLFEGTVQVENPSTGHHGTLHH